MSRFEVVIIWNDYADKGSTQTLENQPETKPLAIFETQIEHFKSLSNSLCDSTQLKTNHCQLLYMMEPLSMVIYLWTKIETIYIYSNGWYSMKIA